MANKRFFLYSGTTHNQDGNGSFVRATRIVEVEHPGGVEAFLGGYCGYEYDRERRYTGSLSHVLTNLKLSEGTVVNITYLDGNLMTLTMGPSSKVEPRDATAVKVFAAQSAPGVTRS